jgi:predicted transcriptional regulator
MNKDQFKEIRHSLGFSLSQMADAIGVEERTIRRYEDGTRAIGLPIQILIDYILEYGIITKS